MNPVRRENPNRYPHARATVTTLFTALLLTACAKNTAPSSTPQSAPSAADAAAATAAPDLAATAGAAIDNATAEAKAAELTQVVRKYAAEKQRAPKSFDEIVAAGYLSAVPEAPAGKTFAIDKNLQVHLANK
jgi:hypothetical protein